MGKRKSLSRRLRFEIFKRDGFRCIYCGTTPLQGELHVDHVVPVVDGGTNEAFNLATACANCNLGKNRVPLEASRLPPAPDIASEATKDHAEQIREYLNMQKAVHQAQLDAATQIASYWESRVGPMSQDMFDRLPALMQKWPYAKLVEAINITARRLRNTEADAPDTYRAHWAVKQAKYFHGILRNWREAE